MPVCLISSDSIPGIAVFAPTGMADAFSLLEWLFLAVWADTDIWWCFGEFWDCLTHEAFFYLSLSVPLVDLFVFVTALLYQERKDCNLEILASAPVIEKAIPMPAHNAFPCDGVCAT